MISRTRLYAAVACMVLGPTSVAAQVTKADYDRAMGLRDKYQYLTLNVPEPATWIEKTARFITGSRSRAATSSSWSTRAR